MIGIIDAGIGNVGSIRNMFKKIGVAAEIVSDTEGIARATKLVLPGVGAFDAGMSRLHASGLLPSIEDRALTDRIPVLGICLGMQLMTQGSDEGSQPGLGWVAARTHRFLPEQLARLRVPHMGWNRVHPVRAHALTDNLDEEGAFYFVHSYYVRCAEPANVLLTAHHGIEFVASFEHGNLLGVQFHPEKSHRYGMQLLRNFAGITP